MNWTILKTDEEWEKLLERSAELPQVVFKHSIRCSVSSMVKSKFEKKSPAGIDFHYLDLIAYRSLSNRIADDTGVRHESPQVLLIRNGKCIYHDSHIGINMDDVVAEAM